jgi:hypothetical protein
MNKYFFFSLFCLFNISLNAFSEFYLGTSFNQSRNIYTKNNKVIAENYIKPIESVDEPIDESVLFQEVIVINPLISCQDTYSEAQCQVVLKSAKRSDSTSSRGLSILTGYRKTGKLFFIGSEFELDFTNVFIKGNSKEFNSLPKSLTLKYNKTFSLKGQLGWNVKENKALYLNFGGAARKVNISYSSFFFIFNETKTMFYGLIGVGYEAKITKELFMFAEYNHVFALNGITTHLYQ